MEDYQNTDSFMACNLFFSMLYSFVSQISTIEALTFYKLTVA
jgi:hypothetical protein